PGATEEECLPILEKLSNLKAGIDFGIGYSPERINPGDRVHRLENIIKVVSANNPETLKIVADVYASIVKAGIYSAPNIRVAEAAKVIENTQRDLNIALMNELALICHKLDIDTQEVLNAASTKWNFLKFTPGLVGGHCIGVDPYYLTHRAEQVNYHPEVILAGRRINDSMGQFVAHEAIRLLNNKTWSSKPLVTILGLTFKENVPDIRNTRVTDIVHELKSFNIDVQIADPLADPNFVYEEYQLNLVSFDKLKPASCVILAVPHKQYCDQNWKLFDKILLDQGIVMDIKSSLDPQQCPKNITLWRL
ncbi:MAG: nucleotide sugar dehydrogenase, partial [Alphaproteobacteria bacterium]|nr:nucleotide sugar dehydrogenase [Alphaproteobacteria bacterium]